ncbi:tubulin polymerization-promoting protein homolog [Pollicipes pollicipes]|uniref:tubulin polymerization-promoting protein homolog n=1 Tax=Pollicipes pollicipes TaxID=41117 RepID=UPI0018856567|nr:tubulin polymerization-promoting protein homolog [Pollicipes pollicipes]
MTAPTLESQFKKFCGFGITHSQASASPVTQITLSNIDKWFKQAGVFTKSLTTTDTGIHFGKLKQKKVGLKDFKTFLADLAATKKVDLDEIQTKLTDCGDPGTKGATKAVTTGAVGRLTDTSRYTGQHKERFDETGKGRGIAGREDIHGNDGYVQGYKEKDSYDKTH